MPEPEAGTVAQSKGRRRGARTGCPWDHAAARAGFETRGRAAKKTPSRTGPGRHRRSAARDAAGDSLHAATRARRSQPAGRRRRMRRKEHAGTTGLSRTWCGRGRFAAARPRLRRLERPCAAARGAAPDRELPPRHAGAPRGSRRKSGCRARSLKWPVFARSFASRQRPRQEQPGRPAPRRRRRTGARRTRSRSCACRRQVRMSGPRRGVDPGILPSREAASTPQAATVRAGAARTGRSGPPATRCFQTRI